VAWLIPIQYTATAIIMPPQQQQSISTALLGQIGAIASLGGKDLGLKNPSDLYVGIARSRTVADEIIGRFGLKALYGERTMAATRKQLEKYTQIESARDTLIKISVSDREPKRAADLANAYVEELYKQNSRLAVTESAQRRLFFENQLAGEKNALAAAEVSLKQTQQRTGVLQVNTQAEVGIRAIAALRAEIATREVALERLRLAATSNNSEVISLEVELSGMRAQLHKLEQTPNRRGDPLIPPSRLPEVGIEYMRGLRELTYHETLFELLAKQYVAAKIDEAKDAPVIQIIDHALPPDQKSWPPRAILSLAGMLTAFLVGSALAFVKYGGLNRLEGSRASNS
jgi:uncharacterized protein involved in exopolysaccharide biosynthesis